MTARPYREKRTIKKSTIDDLTLGGIGFLRTLLILFVVYEGGRIATAMEHMEALQSVPIIAASVSGE